jgi:hypothetical protein
MNFCVIGSSVGFGLDAARVEVASSRVRADDVISEVSGIVADVSADPVAARRPGALVSVVLALSRDSSFCRMHSSVGLVAIVSRRGNCFSAHAV